jgi:xanthine phosphoribosyltransferase
MTEAVKVDKFFPITWDELHRNAKALAWRLIEAGPWQGIIAVTRGGLVPAAIVARELNVQIIETISAVAYNDDDTKPAIEPEVKIIKSAANVGDGKGWIIIDDLVDTGRTFATLRKLYPKAHFATIYAKPKGRAEVNTYVTEVSQDTWIYFPWYLEPLFVQPIAFQKREP